MNIPLKTALTRIGRNAGALTLMIGTQLVANQFNFHAPAVAGIPLTLFAAPVLNAAAKFGREHLDEGFARTISQIF